jgi:murein DD-endopeptidase MepM/ murein hydrolase activator NlpD
MQKIFLLEKINQHPFLRKHQFLAKMCNILTLSFLVLSNALLPTLKFIFTKKTILFISDKKITSINFHPILQAIIIVSLLFFGFSFYNFWQYNLQYNNTVDNKLNEIERLKQLNNYFANELEVSNKKLEKINQYLNTINSPILPVNNQLNGIEVPKKIETQDLSSENRQILNTIKQLHQNFSCINNFNNHRIKKIEEAIAFTGLNFKKHLDNNKLQQYSKHKNISHLGLGGPETFDPELEKELLAKNLSTDYLELHLEKNKFNNQVEKLQFLEKISQKLPFYKPMQNFYISSGFGVRIDPFTGKHHTHEGLDFVGIDNAKILSPSNGKVILAKWFSDYGNAVVIDHGYGITTRYGHLSKIKVKEGDLVTRGQIIALQGNTGRSTGKHLHYEVRYKNTPLNPKRFLEAGNIINSSNFNYVNS